jgi:2-dehydro-3-deoxyphosphogluconate aldolase/(4S)-4-hydroxy-2-oxoglutarate aldolase
VIENIAPQRLIAIVRTRDPEQAVHLAEAIVRGGVSSIEIALTTPDAFATITELTSRLADRALVGAGTVRTAGDARSAIAAGARFLVAPDFNEGVLDEARSAGIPYVPGALTPSEVGTILEAGVEMIKIFPAGRMGPAYIRDLLGPFPQLCPVPTGGVDLSNAAQFLQAGAVALGVGSALTGGGVNDLEGVSALTRRWTQLINARRVEVRR